MLVVLVIRVVPGCGGRPTWRPHNCLDGQPVKEKVSVGVTTPPIAALVKLAGVW